MANSQMGVVVKAYWKFKRENPESKMTMKEFFKKVNADRELLENAENNKRNESSWTKDVVVDKKPEPAPVVVEQVPEPAPVYAEVEVDEPPPKPPARQPLPVVDESGVGATGRAGFFSKMFKRKEQKWTDPEDRRWV